MTEQIIHWLMLNVECINELYQWWPSEIGMRRLQSCTSTVSARTSWCPSQPSAVSLLSTDSIQLLQFLSLNTLLKCRAYASDVKVTGSSCQINKSICIVKRIRVHSEWHTICIYYKNKINVVCSMYTVQSLQIFLMHGIPNSNKLWSI